jgi:predicted dehydrogenase
VTDRLRIAIVGAGDVAHRHYLPALASRADAITLAAVADPRERAGERVAAAAADWSPGTRVFLDLDDMLRDGELDAVFDLTPAPSHGEVNRAILEAGLACYSEKPITSTVEEADGLISLAAARGLLLMCAPGSAVTNRFRWLQELAASGRLGKPTLAVAHHADPGPAAWREYTGDPTPFYRNGVGPVFDHGVYRLHEMTTVLGPVRRVGAIGSLALPTRRVLGGPLAGQTIEVTTPDHVLMHLEFTSGALGQLLASFATADTLAPWFELHLEHGVVSFGGRSWELDAPVQVFDATDPAAVGDWRPAEPPPDEFGVVESGARHFIDCLAGEGSPVLTAEHARHVLEIILAAYASIDDSQSHELRTTFGQA